MSNMRDLLDLVNEMSEEQSLVEVQDSFDIELSEDFVIETGVVDITEDGIIIEGDDRVLELLAEHGFILEETDWSKYDEPTASRIKKGVTKPVDKTDYNKPAVQRKKEKEEKKLDEKMVMGSPAGEGSKVMGEAEMDEAKYQGREVKLGKPMAGDVKKSKVYVRGPKGNVVKVNFGDKKMRIKKSNPNRRKSFRARHNCDNPGPRWKARYWSCRAW
jgi:hypothetical protein